MNKLVGFALACTVILVSCDKVVRPIPVAEPTELNYDLYPGGDAVAYESSEWPTFAPNTNTLRNIMIEDFTGHQCTYCSLAADEAHDIHTDYPSRVFIATIHSGPGGYEGNQYTSADYPIDWTNPDGLDIGTYFGSKPSSQFIGNPSGTVNRIPDAQGRLTLSVLDWRLYTETAMLDPLQVKIQSAVNYYPSTRGVFLHDEIEVVDAGISNELYTVVYLVEDSIVGPQKMPDASQNLTYVHRDVMRDCIGSGWKGKKMNPEDIENGKYFFNYSFALPTEYEASNTHLLIYVRDQFTDEIYQVIRQDIE